jgi:RNA polymerase sigma-70 factor (ECF subfamily)
MQYYPRLAYFAENLTNNKQEAEDIVSSVFARLWENMNNSAAQEITNVQAWLFASVRNTCYNFLKHQRVIQTHQEKTIDNSIDETVEANLIEEDIVHRLFLEIQELPPKCRQVAELVYIRGYTSSEVGEMLGIASSTVRTQQARAIELIRTSLIKKKIFVEGAYIIFSLFFRQM